MRLALVLALVALGGGDALSRVKLGGLSFVAPQAWQATADDSGKTWASPDEKATLAVSVFPVDPVRPASVCVKQLVAAVGKDGFEDLTVGAQPAARKVTTDFVGKDDSAKTEANKVTTTTVLGCDGRTKWVLTYSARTSDGARLGALLKQVLSSVRYGK